MNIPSTARYEFFSARETMARSWLLDQLLIQARGLAGNLDRVWPDVKDSKWIGGSREGWERVPYWLDGFIPLAWLLRDSNLITRAEKYVNAIVSAQQPDGWICPCPDSGRAEYDVWAVMLICKVLMLHHDCSGSPRSADAARRALFQLNGHLDAHPLFAWGKSRWFEALIPIHRLYSMNPEPWLLELAEKLERQGTDYKALFSESWPYSEPQHEWKFDSHVVNMAMALKAGVLADVFAGASESSGFSEKMLAMLMKHHGTAAGHFNGDECLSGTSPIQGAELCSIAEAMFSFEVNFAMYGDPAWLDRLEDLAFNSFPATITPDMWAHQYDQQVNQIGCAVEPEAIWSTNSPDAHIFGLEPNFGCCTANMGQAFPKLALSAFMRAPDGILSAVPVPSSVKTRIGNAEVEIALHTMYPFRDTLRYSFRASEPVRFVFHVRIPKCAASAEVDGAPAEPGSIVRIEREWSTGSAVNVQLRFEPEFVERPSGMYVLRRGPLLYALPIDSECNRLEYERDGVERKYPYCDYEMLPASDWNYAFAGKPESPVTHNDFKQPFNPSSPPVELRCEMVKIPWGINPGSLAICAEKPDALTPLGPPEEKRLIPYGCTMLRMTEMPLLPF
ncbi:MAG: beta-L-arabinofuranosidase domain-containing protein [Victivallaceae bacterium]|nr:glycoside hydrolase family 127 protein [Victivallaceae bacterium]